MKNKHLILSLFIVSCLSLCLLAISCKKFNANVKQAVDKDSFEFKFENPIVNVRCGETVSYTVKLHNRKNEAFILSHALPLITLYVYNSGDNTEEAVGASLIKSTIAADGFIEKNISVQFTESGEYMLRAYCSFSIEENQYYYDIDPIKICVTD